MASHIVVPSDKSISHRALIISSLSEGKVKIENFLFAEDCLSTASVLSDLGVDVRLHKPNAEAIVSGVGKFGFTRPKKTLYAGNSGTTIRIMSGVLAAQGFDSVIDGDASLRKRPMLRVVNPLTKMGARITGRKRKDKKGRLNVFAPLKIYGRQLSGAEIVSNVASAQVKTAVILAGLCAKGKTYYKEPVLSRDHTERMLKLFGIRLARRNGWIVINGNKVLVPPEGIFVPGDISSAAFFIVYGLISKNKKIIIKSVGINPTRSGILSVVKRMGGSIRLVNRINSPEPYADIVIKSSNLKGIRIKAEELPSLIDEVPVISVLAAFAKGKTYIEAVDELRVKESDRVAAIVRNLSAFGVQAGVVEKKNRTDLVIYGAKSFLRPKGIKAFADHRIAMSMAVMLSVLDMDMDLLDDKECVRISYPSFWDTLLAVTKGADYGI